MRTFKLFLGDLTDDARARFLDFINDPDNVDNNYDIYPIVTLAFEDETFD